MTDDLGSLSIDEKRRRVREKLRKQAKVSTQPTANGFDLTALPEYARLTYDLAATSTSIEHAESRRFSSWLDDIQADDAYSFEVPRLGGQTPEVEVERTNGLRLRLLNCGSYNYLGYSMHPAVIEAAKAALDRYGIGAASSPILSGTLALHRELEQSLLDFYGLVDHGVSIFSSGYGANMGTIPAFIKQGHYVILDRSAHMSIQEGAQLSKARILYFRHNDPENLNAVLTSIAPERVRKLVCTEGLFSADGDFGRLREIVAVCKRHGAAVMVDEAHSILVAGQRGRGVCEAEEVLNEVDLIVITFSKGFGGIGGALIARRELARYVNWYAKDRMFSCALDPAVTGGMIKVLELARSDDGTARRKRIHENAKLLRELLCPYVDIGDTESWIVPVFYRHGELTFVLNDFLQRRGLDSSIMQFPAVPKGEARVRLFVTSEHTGEQLRRVARIIREAAEHFEFTRGNAR
ncbi:glycine C-acetyltransferase [Paraburkholderia sp. BL18I3N2]|uniref:aminotransferase class I/II-fold pyridoxal phosphate-dependent enzyme n=1 Tax=unclassified Paraburkholderia TaxID=2615204 RepID=UPI000D06B92D|nr:MULTISPECIES: aminotransferase class I/II-fold pyridoxal phosphate-dependent enzyme [unclassified Paraburkholderia]PRX24033.1 glycine C-acetyltransferase [Paraburkholderia sp. BL18I3N2]PRX87519.1 glycine C-acetyltransferase [Paraburkholderia sp. BL25I1N1]